MKFNVPVVFKVKASSEEEARAKVNRLMQYGFDGIVEHEPETFKAIRNWNWAKIRGEK